ncbi:unnamed protein product [Enterobius vermicularis]|uniref:Metallophos domain-containing protein n=1 Tax=Enterobius vermicularis TaxID=51028 RepID=A0A0N4VPC9_ENTVE|nr:unnamed protein product [Enterobius vermicularis]
MTGIKYVMSAYGSFRRLHRFQRLYFIRYFILLIVLAIFWNEYLSYEYSALLWVFRLPHYDSQTVKILIVADPQLIGYQNEGGMYPGIKRWDADRYLKKGFSRVLRVASPDVVVFLGDLFDEGTQMTDQEFEWTLERFNKIFDMPRDIQKLYVPGDNDVGGEDSPVSERLVERFQNKFVSSFDSNVLGLDDFDFFYVNGFNEQMKKIFEGTGDLKFVLSHMPLLRAHGSLQKLRVSLNPSLIISAHDHKAEFYQDGRSSYNFYRSSLFTYSKAIEMAISKDDPCVELQSPTCSYRMGVHETGYGNEFYMLQLFAK